MTNIHVLQKMEILRSFEIAKFIPDDELKKIKDEYKHLPKKERLLEFEKKIDEIGRSSRQMDIIPGIITPKSQAIRTENLLKASIKIANEIRKTTSSKEEQSFIIASLTKLLELRLKDFNNWKDTQKENNKLEDESNEDDVDDGDLEDN